MSQSRDSVKWPLKTGDCLIQVNTLLKWTFVTTKYWSVKTSGYITEVMTNTGIPVYRIDTKWIVLCIFGHWAQYLFSESMINSSFQMWETDLHLPEWTFSFGLNVFGVHNHIFLQKISAAILLPQAVQKDNACAMQGIPHTLLQYLLSVM